MEHVEFVQTRLELNILEEDLFWHESEILGLDVSQCAGKCIASSVDCLLFGSNKKCCSIGTLTNVSSTRPMEQITERVYVNQKMLQNWIPSKFFKLTVNEVPSGNVNWFQNVSTRSDCYLGSMLVKPIPNLFGYSKSTSMCFEGFLTSNQSLHSTKMKGVESLYFHKDVLKSLVNRNSVSVPCGSLDKLMKHILESKTVQSSLECLAYCIMRGQFCHLVLLLGYNECLLVSFNQKLDQASRAQMVEDSGATNCTKTIVLSPINRLRDLEGNEVFESKTFSKYVFSVSTIDEEVPITCLLKCLLAFHPLCSFYLEKSGVCYLGNFQVQPNLTFDLLTNERIQVIQGSDWMSNSTQHLVPLSSLVWGLRIYNWTSPVGSENICGSMCLLRDLDMSCDFFVFVEDTCFFGNLTFNKGLDLLDSVFHGTPIIVKGVLDYSKYLPALNSFQSQWSEKIYKQQKVLNWEQCHGLCYLDSGPCYIFTFFLSDGTCSLGDWNSKSEKYYVNPNSTIYQYEPQAMLVTGGERNILFLESMSTCYDPGVLGHPTKLTYESAAIHKSLLFVCGGSNVQNLTEGGCFRIDLALDFPFWERMPNLPFPQLSMGLLLTAEDGFLYYFGGESGSLLSSKVAKFDVEFNQWYDARADMVVPLKRHCGVEYKGSFWIIGGETSGISKYTSRVSVFNPSTLTWTQKGFYPVSSARSKVHCGTSVHMDTKHDLLWVLGGSTNTLEELVDVNVYDLTLDSGYWRTLPSLPSGLPYGKLPNAVFAFGPGEVYFVPHQISAWEGWTSMMRFNWETHKFQRHPKSSYQFNVSLTSLPTKIPLHWFWDCIPQAADWSLVASHNVSSQWFAFDQFLLNSSNLYINQSRMRELRDCDERFHLRLVYPELGYFNEWSQDSDPTNSSQTSVTGFQAITMKYATYFNGLRYSAHLGVALMSGDQREDAKTYSVGTMKNIDNQNQIHGPVLSNGSEIFVRSLRLLMKNLC
ncbi:uncharacterized protein LOC131891271 [Tigriopus californicus]|uniref:uncharacterized protein LOC131891271 n=1 Tax=Tigriopus californicus TaxID=6832 RepID=UPI0027DAA413|nr:uncharacterized protein LOC131891271 [Tigriopus californicus]